MKTMTETKTGKKIGTKDKVNERKRISRASNRTMITNAPKEANEGILSLL